MFYSVKLKKSILFFSTLLFMVAFSTNLAYAKKSSPLINYPNHTLEYYSTTIKEAENSIKINSAPTMYFNQLVFVSPMGSDSTGDGSENKPYQTILKAMSKLWSSGNKTLPSAVILDDGTGNFFI